MDKKRLYYIIIPPIIIILAVIGGLLFRAKNLETGTGTPKGAETGQGSGQENPSNQSSTPTSTSGLIKKTLESVRQGTSRGQNESVPTSTGELLPRGETDLHDGNSFEEAMRIYASSGYRFQFVECHGNPGRLVMKQGKKFMLDNRDDSQHSFGISAKTYDIEAYDFAIATAIDLGTYFITCDGGGAAEMNVQP